MRRVIKGRLYDTESARPIGEAEGIKVYRTKTGNFFAAGIDITPMTLEEARDWSIRQLGSDQTDPPEQEAMATVTISMTATERQQLIRLAQASGQTVSAYIRAKCLV